jgi:hypothetical protein
MTTIHNLKVHPQFWDGLASGAKPFEIRRNDRRFAVGDICLLREYDPKHGYTGKDAIERKITYILHNEDFPIGLHLGFVALGFDQTDATLEQAARICDEITSWGLSPTKLEVAESTQRFCAKAIRAQKSDSEERKRHEAKAASDDPS